uniref:Uncharacterized protein n=1 Tax=Acrobeloides nanus TaxID=290746 RepID=A0A914D489_9BILA
MVALRKIRSHLLEFRRFIRSPRSTIVTARSDTSGYSRKLFFWPSKKSDSGSESSHNISTPDSARSVSFDEAICWPYIDEDESSIDLP